MQKLYVKTTPFYIRDLSIHGFWYPEGSWNQSLVDIERQLYYSIIEKTKAILNIMKVILLSLKRASYKIICTV